VALKCRYGSRRALGGPDGQQRARALNVVPHCCCTELRRPSIWKVFARAQRRFWVPFSVLILEKHPRPPNLQKTVKPQRVRFDFALKRARS
jgi:hypothetical protein